ncbi:MAG: hypothetical protein WC565_08445 [Parcubacteria group bacterium]
MGKAKADGKLVTLVGGDFDGEKYRIPDEAYRLEPQDGDDSQVYYRDPDKPDRFVIDSDDIRLLPYKVRELVEAQAARDARLDFLEEQVRSLEESVHRGVVDEDGGKWSFASAIVYLSAVAKSRWMRWPIRRFHGA